MIKIYASSINIQVRPSVNSVANVALYCTSTNASQDVLKLYSLFRRNTH